MCIFRYVLKSMFFLIEENKINFWSSKEAYYLFNLVCFDNKCAHVLCQVSLLLQDSSLHLFPQFRIPPSAFWEANSNTAFTFYFILSYFIWFSSFLLNLWPACVRASLCHCHGDLKLSIGPVLLLFCLGNMQLCSLQSTDSSILHRSSVV